MSDSIPVSSGKPSALPMMPGIQQGRVVDVGDLQERENQFGERNADGSVKKSKQAPVTFRDATGREARRWYTPSFHERANLSKDIKSVRGDGTLPPASSFNLKGEWPNGLMNMQAQLLIGPHVANARGYVNAKIQAVMPAAAGQNVPVVPPLCARSNQPPPNAPPGVYPVPPVQQYPQGAYPPAQPAAAPAAPPAGVPTTSEVGF